MKKKAVVLLITIGFIGILSALILQTVTISKSSFDELMNIKEENQMILLLKNIDEILRKQNSEDIKNYFVDKTLPIMDKKSGLNITIHCSDLNKKLNINKLLSKKCTKEICKEVILKYLKEKELDDSEYFYKLLKEISKNSDGSEFFDDEVYKGDIVSFTSIEKVKTKYMQQIRDSHEEKITKEDFKQVFYYTQANTIESNITMGNTMIPGCKKLGFFEEDSEECINYLDNIKNTLNKIFNKTNPKNKYIVQTKDLIECNVKLYKKDNIHKMVFIYDLSPKSKNKIVSIDEFF